MVNLDIRKPDGSYNEKSTYICGVDCARTGKDETAIVVLEQLPFDNNIFLVHIETSHTPDLNMVVGRVKYLNQIFNFKRIMVDETGLGAGVCDMLKSNLGVKVEGIWYTQKIKAEMFYNLKLLMTRPTGKLFIPDYNSSNDPIVRKMYYQFLSIQQEFNNSEVPKIFHEERSHDDIVNAVALAAYYWKVGQNKKKYHFLGIN
jgi:hypothetical protein